MVLPLGMADTANYDTLFAEKARLTKEEFDEFKPPKLKTFRSTPEHFRMRAEFKIWHESGVAHYAMYKPGEYKKPVKLSAFTIGSKTICDLMSPLLDAVNKSETLKHKLFQVEFLTTSTEDAIVTLIYHKRLDEAWQAEAEALTSQLKVKIIGRSRRQKVTLSEDFVIEEFCINGKKFQYQQVETGFTQPNAHV